MPKLEEKPFQIDLTGRLITGYDATKIVQESDRRVVVNFQTLENMMYNDRGIEGVPGMSKINTTVITTYTSIRNMFQFVKSQPAETHLLIQAYNSGETASQVMTNTTAIPSQGDFSGTALHTDDSAAGKGRFSYAPLAHICYCNSVETMIYGGTESRVAGFILYDDNAAGFTRDYTEKVKNTKTDSDNIATLLEDGNGTVSLYVGNVMPIENIKFYIVTANATAGTLSVDYWTGSAWSAVSSLSDGTQTGGDTPLGQTGTVTFTSTETTAKTSIREGVMGFWYRVQITNCDSTTTVSQVTLGVPFQPIQDLYDGIPRKFVKVYYDDDSATAFLDNTVNVAKDEYYYDTSTGGDTSTYMVLSGMATADSIFVGTFERIQGFQVKLIPGDENNVAATTMTVSSWDDGAWSALTITDGTSQNSISLAQNGFVTWEPRGENVEFKQSIGGEEALYFYKITFDKVLTADAVRVFFMSYIPVQNPIQGYKFSLAAKNRLMLFSDQNGERNSMIPSQLNTLNVFNGSDAGARIFFGQDNVDLEAAVEVFARFTGNLQSIIVVCQKSSTYLLFGNSPEDWKVPPMPVSSEVGCSAPLTMKASPIGFEFAPLNTKQVAIWVHSTGVYMYDVENGLNVISGDIKDVFDQRESTAINLSAIGEATAAWNVFNGEYYYHLLYPSGSATDCDKEVVFDLKRHKWFFVDRTKSSATNKDLQVIAEIKDADGNNYTYGAEDLGFVQRLNNGNDFDGNDIIANFRIADIAFEKGSTLLVTQPTFVQMPQVAKNTTTNDITCTHYVNAKTTGVDFTLDPAKTNELAIPSMSQGTNLDSGVFHSLAASLTTNDEVVPFEPLFLSIKYVVKPPDWIKSV